MIVNKSNLEDVLLLPGADDALQLNEQLEIYYYLIPSRMHYAIRNQNQELLGF